MTDALITVLNMSIAASIVAVAVILVRFPLKKAPKVFSYLLWGVVFLRLICPFHFESPASLMPTNAEIIPPAIAMEPVPQIDSGITAVDEPVNRLIEQTIPAANPVVSANPVQVILAVGAVIWLLGVAVLLGYAVIGYLRLKRRVFDATLERDNVYVTDKIPTAFVLGLLRPKVYVPASAEGAQLDHILKHEQVHIRRRDYLIKPLAFLILAVHWFNPIVWLSYYLMSRDMEMSCDEAVLRKAGEDIRQGYSTSLLSLYTRKPGLLSPLAFGEGSYTNMKARIKNVLHFKKTPRWAIVLCSFVLVLFAAGFTTNPPEKLKVENLVGNPIANVPDHVVTVESPAEAVSPAIVLENVEMYHYPGEDGYPYIHDIVTNNTGKMITGYQQGMLVLDKDGKPLQIDWYPNDMFHEEDRAYYNVYYSYDDEILSGETYGTDDPTHGSSTDEGGWSLNASGEDKAVDRIAYVLYCYEQITFKDGTVWNNPDFANWRKTYEGQTVDVTALENYYPYTQKVSFANSGVKVVGQADYKVVDLVAYDLPIYPDRHPTANDISREKAAAIGVKGWEDVFGIDLEGKEVEMAYYPAENGYRAHWVGEYWYNGKKKPGDLYGARYYFLVDSVTGELLTVQHFRVLDEDVDVGSDAMLNADGSGEYRALAEKEALEYGAIQNAVKEIVSIGQGSSNNDPVISFEMTGESGERARIRLSRYDGALLAIFYDGMMREIGEL